MQFAEYADRPSGRPHSAPFQHDRVLGFGMRMASMFVFASSSIGRDTGLIPKWSATVNVVGLVLLFAFTVAVRFALLFAVWVLVVCIIAPGGVRRPPRSRPTRPSGSSRRICQK